MKKLLLLTGVLLFCVTAAQAGILSRFFNPYGYNNYYYPPSNVRYYNSSYYPNTNYYNNYNRTNYPNNAYRYNNYNNYNRYNNGYRMYNNPYRNNGYYRQPIIHRNVINRKSMNNSKEVKVASQIKDLDKLERKVLRQTYEGDSVKNRIERLEQGMFGAVQTGDIYERYDTLKRMAKIIAGFKVHITQGILQQVTETVMHKTVINLQFLQAAQAEAGEIHSGVISKISL